MTAEEFLKKKLDMKYLPLSLTLKNDKLFALMDEYHEARMKEIPEIADEEIENHFCNLKIDADFTLAEKGLMRRNRMDGAKWYRSKLKKRMTK